MASLLRRLYRKALDTELGGVGDELVEAQDRLDAIMERFHRLQARIGMRELRAGATQRGVELGGSLEDRLRVAAANQAPRRGNGNGKTGWPEADE